MGTYEAGVSAYESVWNLYMVCIERTDMKQAALRFLLGANVATWAIPFLYYTYMGVLGFSKMWLDIANIFCGSANWFRCGVSCVKDVPGMRALYLEHGLWQLLIL